LSGKRDGVRVLIIIADKDDREFENRGEVESFMKVSAARGSIPKIGHGDSRLPSDLKGQRHTRGDRDPVGHRANESDNVATDVTEVNIAILAPRGPRSPSQILGHIFLRLDPLHEMHTEASVGWSNDIIRRQGTRAPHGDRFFAGTDIAPTHDPSLAIHFDDPVLQAPGQAKIIVELEQIFDSQLHGTPL
jgi:hypothetical protein